MKLYMPDGQVLDTIENPDSLTIYPGSFNPLHYGHTGLADMLIEKGHNVVFEISQTRYKKPAYSDKEVEERVRQFAWKYPVVVTQDAPLFFDKFRIFSKWSPRFVMGYDTLKRWLDMTNPSEIPDGLKFVLSGRMVKGEYLDCRDLWDNDGPFNVEVEFLDLKADISSTDIRNKQ